MKKHLNLLLILPALLLTAFSVCAQTNVNNLVVFSQDGDKFTLIVNGLRQNEKPETNVKVTGLTAPNYKVRVLFENANLAPIDQMVYLMDGGENVTNKEFTYVIANGKKGMKLKGQSVADITPQGAPAAGQVVYVFNPSGDATPYSTTTTTTSGTQGTGGSVTMNVSTSGDPNAGNMGTSTTVNDGSGQASTTTTTTSTTTTGTTDNANVGMNMGGVGLGININVNDGTGGTGTTTTTTTTTTYSSTTTTSGTVDNGGTTTTTAVPPSTTSTSTSCSFPMSSADFEKAKNSISAQGFDESREKIAKQVLNTNCMSTAQVKEIMALFSFEETKLDWAKFAYGKTTDPQNYYQLNDGFSFSSSVDDLNSYIESHQK